MKPIHPILRFLFGRILGWLVYHSNRRFHGRQSWYALKDLVLARWSTADGCDLQVLPPAECWSCDKGKPRDTSRWGLRSDGTCASCDGHGIYTPERYVRLERRKLGPYVFHSPGSTATRNELHNLNADFWARTWKAHTIIHGLINHAPSKRQRWLGVRTKCVLELLFDTRRFAPVLVKRIFRRPIAWWEEQQRQWRYGMHRLQAPRYSPWHREPDYFGYLDDDLPF